MLVPGGSNSWAHIRAETNAGAKRMPCPFIQRYIHRDGSILGPAGIRPDTDLTEIPGAPEVLGELDNAVGMVGGTWLKPNEPFQEVLLKIAVFLERGLAQRVPSTAVIQQPDIGFPLAGTHAQLMGYKPAVKETMGLGPPLEEAFHLLIATMIKDVARRRAQLIRQFKGCQLRGLPADPDPDTGQANRLPRRHAQTQHRWLSRNDFVTDFPVVITEGPHGLAGAVPGMRGEATQRCRVTVAERPDVGADVGSKRVIFRFDDDVQLGCPDSGYRQDQQQEQAQPGGSRRHHPCMISAPERIATGRVRKFG